jgi:hypothetical protein
VVLALGTRSFVFSVRARQSTLSRRRDFQIVRRFFVLREEQRCALLLVTRRVSMGYIQESVN